MKRESIHEPKSETIVLLTALAFGLGIAFHKVFFGLAAAIALSVPFGRLADYLREASPASGPRERAS